MKTFYFVSDFTLYTHTCSSESLARGLCGPRGCCELACPAATSEYSSPPLVGLICKTLEYITVAKKNYFKKQICNSKNKIKPTWNFVKTITGRIPMNDIHTLNIDGKIIRNNELICN